jgi:hypothetical protein
MPGGNMRGERPELSTAPIVLAYLLSLATPGPQPGVISRELHDLMDRGLPESGVVEAVYASTTGDEARFGIDFASGAWYAVNEVFVSGCTPAGVYYSRDFKAGGPRREQAASPFASLQIASCVPAVWLLEMRRHPESIVSARAVNDGYEVAVDTSGPGRPDKPPTQVTIGSDGRVLRVVRPDRPSSHESIEYAPNCPYPLAASLRHTGHALVSFETPGPGGEARFSPERAESLGSLVRFNSRQARSAQRAAAPPGAASTPAQTTPSSSWPGANLNTPIIVTGTSLIVIGVVAWWLRRRSSPRV